MGKIRPEVLNVAERLLTCPAREFHLDGIEEILQSDTRISTEEMRVLRRLARIGLAHTDWTTRSMAAELLTDLGAREDRFALESALRDPDWGVRCSAASALGLGIGSTTFALLRTHADDPHPIVRRYIYVAMFDADAAKALPWLLARLAVEIDEEARIGLLSALAEGGIAEVIPELREFLSHPDSRVRGLAAEALGPIDENTVDL